MDNSPVKNTNKKEVTLFITPEKLAVALSIAFVTTFIGCIIFFASQATVHGVEAISPTPAYTGLSTLGNTTSNSPSVRGAMSSSEQFGPEGVSPSPTLPQTPSITPSPTTALKNISSPTPTETSQPTSVPTPTSQPTISASPSATLTPSITITSTPTPNLTATPSAHLSVTP